MSPENKIISAVLIYTQCNLNFTFRLRKGYLAAIYNTEKLLRPLICKSVIKWCICDHKMSVFLRLDPNLQVGHPSVSAGTKSRFHSQFAKVWALFQHPARRSKHFMTTMYTFIHWGYVGPSRHPPSLLPTLPVQLGSQSSETICRCLPILAASIQWLSWCVWDRKSHTSLRWGFWWVSEQPWTCCTREKAAEQMQGFRCFCGKEWDNMGHLGEILHVLQGRFKLFYHGVS